MSTTLSQLLHEADLPLAMSEDLDPLMTALRSLGPASAPEPSPQLAALLAHPVTSHRRRFRRGAIAAVAAVVGSFTLTGVAAAVEGILPDPAQQFVADLSESWPLPFQFSPPVTMQGETDTQQKAPDGEAPVAPSTTDEPAQEDPTPDGSQKSEPTQDPSEPTQAPTGEPSPEVSPSAPAAPSEPPPSPSAPAPSEAPSPTLGAEEPTGSPSAGGTSSPSPSPDPTEPDHARENETGTPAPSPTPSAPMPSGSTSPSAG